jgi:diguanylate cyclase (GGDEF)-like protein
MPARLRLPRPQIATKLYGAIALFLAMVYVLAAIAIHFAGRTEQISVRLRGGGLATVEMVTRIEQLLRHHKRLVASAPAVADRGALEADERAYRALTADIAALIPRAQDAGDGRLALRFAAIAAAGQAAIDAAKLGQRAQALASASAYAEAMAGLERSLAAQRMGSLDEVEETLTRLGERARALITWVAAGAAITGLLIGPLGLLLLHRMLTRLQAIGWALIRLARNDTSVDIPGALASDEIGQLARSVTVFKAKSIELLQNKAELERVNLQLDAAINNIPLGLSMFDAQERLLVCNKTYAEMYDVPRELVRPGTVHCALWEHRVRRGARHSETQEKPPEVQAAGTGPARPPSMIIEFGTERVIAVSRQPLHGGGWVSLHEDITKRRRQEEKITHLARHDALTGLANRVLFREQLEDALLRLPRGHGFAVLCLDLDHFKAVNDTLGHPVGDAVLVEAGQRLLACVREGDLVARLGGDEFAIIQASVRDRGQTENLAARIVETVSAPYAIDGQGIDISTSVGITLAPRDGSDAARLMKNADLALYRAKTDGRRTHAFYRTEMNDQVQVRRGLEVDLRRALQREQIELVYQPLVDLQSQRIAAFKVLPSWHHPEHGPLSPGDFASLAEDAGIIMEAGEWMLQRACAQAARWPDDVRVVVNVSALQFQKRNLVEVVLQALAASGLAPARLELDIAESMLLHENKGMLAVLHQLRQLGVGIGLADFGRGYCALSYLRSFPFGTLKIDKGLIATMAHKPDARAIVHSIIGLGRNLGMTTAAEGVESFEQLELLSSWGCGEAQGYLLSPPLPAAETERALGEPVRLARTAAGELSQSSVRLKRRTAMVIASSISPASASASTCRS